MADDGRTYIRLHDGMPDHPKIEPLSDKAFRLLVETWTWCSRHLTDGRVPRATWTRRGTPASRRELMAAGLVEDLGDEGVQMHDYLQHQRSRSEVAEVAAARRAAALKANHSRWHTGPKGKPDPECPLCVASDSDTQSDTETDADRKGERTTVGVHIDRGIGTGRGTAVVLGETLGGGVPDLAAGDAPPAPPNLDPNNPRCVRHRGVPAGDPGPNCRACRDVRLQAEQAITEPGVAERRARLAWRAAVDACAECDENGKLELPDGSLRRHHEFAEVAS